jgi:uncharacterized protein
MSEKPYTIVPGGLRLAVRLTPRAAHNRIDGVSVGADGRAVLAIRLTAPPVEGAANAALVEFLAEALDLRKTDVSIRSGQKSRLKLVDLKGESAVLATKLAALLS